MNIENPSNFFHLQCNMKVAKYPANIFLFRLVLGKLLLAKLHNPYNNKL
jgi:hypothetical protein